MDAGLAEGFNDQNILLPGCGGTGQGWQTHNSRNILGKDLDPY